MASQPDQRVSRMERAAAPPRLNGEVAFNAPWEGRAFGMASALKDRGLYWWYEFSQRLISEVTQAAGQVGTPVY